MNVRIEIDTRTFVRFWLVVIGFVLAALAIYSARTALLIIGASLFFAIVLSPSVNRLAKKLPSKSRALGTALAYIVVVIALGAIVFVVIPPIVDQTTRFIQNLPNIVDSATRQSVGISDFISRYNLQAEVDNVLASIRDGATRFASGIGSALITSIGSVLSAVTAIILILVLTFLMLVEGPSWMSRLWDIYIDKERMEHHREILGRMYGIVTSYAIGQLSVSSIAGVVAGVTVFILSIVFDVPANLAIPTATIVFTSSLIPMFGAMIGAVLVSFILLMNSVPAAAIFIIFFVLYQQVEANYISPKIQSKRIDLSALVILISVTIGIYLFGIVGGIISIPIAGSIKVLLDDYFTTRQKKHAVKKQLKPAAKS